MSRLFIFGLALALIAVGTYVVIAIKNKKKPELADAVVVCIGIVSIIGAVRLTGFVFTKQFEVMAKASSHQGMFSLSTDDALLVMIGGIALIWVSVQTVWQSFSKVRG